MSKFIIKPSAALNGEVIVSGSKNAALPILAAALLCEETSLIASVPQLSDIKNMCTLLRSLGAKVKVGNVADTLEIKCERLSNDLSMYESVRKMRASFLVAGPLLARTGRVKISLPGGCQIGTRPVDLHLKGFSTMGAKITSGNGYIEIRCRKLKGAQIYLDFPSVGATENLMMAAALADGQTIIENAAIEPEIVDLAGFINNMGGKIVGAGTDTIRIVGVKRLQGRRHTVIPDRIEAGTFMTAAAMTRGKVRVNNIMPEHVKPIIAKLREVGTIIQEYDDFLIIDGSERIKATDIKTMPFPGFPTDMQSQFSAMMTIADGTSMIIETIFENRFMHMPELKRMGAKIKIEGRTAVIEGEKKLSGAQVRATDLRAGAALTLAGLVASDTTEISDIEHIDRGYVGLDVKLRALGAKVIRVDS